MSARATTGLKTELRGQITGTGLGGARLANTWRSTVYPEGQQSLGALAGRTTVPLFILVPQVSVKKRLDVNGAGEKWIRMLPQLVLRHWFESA